MIFFFFYLKIFDFYDIGVITWSSYESIREQRRVSEGTILKITMIHKVNHNVFIGLERNPIGFKDLNEKCNGFTITFCFSRRPISDNWW